MGSRDYKNYNPKNFQNDLRACNWDELHTNSNVNDAWAFFKRTLMPILNVHAPIIKKPIKGRQCPWLSADIKLAINDRDKMLRKARKTNKECDWII